MVKYLTQGRPQSDNVEYGAKPNPLSALQSYITSYPTRIGNLLSSLSIVPTVPRSFLDQLTSEQNSAVDAWNAQNEQDAARQRQAASDAVWTSMLNQPQMVAPSMGSGDDLRRFPDGKLHPYLPFLDSIFADAQKPIPPTTPTGFSIIPTVPSPLTRNQMIARALLSANSASSAKRR